MIDGNMVGAAVLLVVGIALIVAGTVRICRGSSPLHSHEARRIKEARRLTKRLARWRKAERRATKNSNRAWKRRASAD